MRYSFIRLLFMACLCVLVFAHVSKAQAQKKKPGDPYVIAFIGENITAGFGLKKGQAYPDELGKMLQVVGWQVTILNPSKSYQTTERGLSKLKSVLPEKPDLIVVEMGTLDGKNHLPLVNTMQNIVRVLERARNENIAILYLGMRPNPRHSRTYRESFHQMNQAIVQQMRLKSVADFMKEVADNPKMKQADDIHPNVEGQKKLAHTLFKPTVELLEMIKVKRQR